jgi:threonyl-tRNA synthetase
MKTHQELECVRHSLAHLLAAAVMRLWPDTKNTIGPAIDNGFYYDFEFTKPISDKDLPKIEKKMRETLKDWNKFEEKEITVAEAHKLFKDNPYKLELVDEIVAKGEKITIYTSGRFSDLCRGGHIDDAQNINLDSFKLDRIAGAYWRGDEKNKMLTRIYGLAFETKEELDAYIAQKEEALKRDHKKLGKELGLFVFSDLVGAGLPLWTPKGTILRDALNDFVWELRKEKGYQKVTIPHITKRALYETSGHWAKYGDDLFKIKTREGHEYALKPMNCPHHTQIFDSSMRSYRDMPQRYAETTMVYRDEQSGELSGLSRVLSITQDDAHVFCREIQIEEEMLAIWDIIDTFYKTFGFNNLQVRFSRHDPAHFEKCLGTKETWAKAEGAIKKIIEKRGIEWIDGLGEAAFYGPKLDFIAHDSIGRVLQVATIQLDFNMPERFKLFCINEKSEKEQVVMIHCAIMGSIERFMATLIEHLAGNFPAWLSPIQVMILPITDDHLNFALEITEKLKAVGIRAELDNSRDGLGKKVRNAKVEKLPYWIVIGAKEIETKKISLEHREKGQLEQMSIDEVIEKLQKEIKEKTL